MLIQIVLQLCLRQTSEYKTSIHCGKMRSTVVNTGQCVGVVCLAEPHAARLSHANFSTSSAFHQPRVGETAGFQPGL